MDLSLATSSSHQDQEGENRDYHEEHRNDVESSQNPHNVVEKEHMFDKVVTPSDVGKLNRLVIPKQHAERYFPLDSASNLNGMLLNFEDRNGKAWRFRYSYWNSSQSYVITKGWSRFVKEKKLDAGDVVSFHRGTGVLGRDKLYIDWRHRPSPDPMAQQLYFGNNNFNLNFNFPRSVHYGSRVYNNSYPPGITMPVFRNYDYRNSIRNLNFEVPQPHHMMPNREQEIIGYGYGMRSLMDRNHIAPLVIDSVPVVPGRIQVGASTAADVVAPATAVAGKRLRLFGVNMDCGGGLCTQHETSNSDGMPRGEMGAASSSRLQERGDDDYNDDGDDDDDQHAKKGKSSLSFGFNLMR